MLTISFLVVYCFRHFSTVPESSRDVLEYILIRFIQEKSVDAEYQVEVVNQYVNFILIWLDSGVYSLAVTADVVAQHLEKSLLRLQCDSR